MAICLRVVMCKPARLMRVACLLCSLGRPDRHVILEEEKGRSIDAGMTAGLETKNSFEVAFWCTLVKPTMTTPTRYSICNGNFLTVEYALALENTRCSRVQRERILRLITAHHKREERLDRYLPKKSSFS